MERTGGFGVIMPELNAAGGYSQGVPPETCSLFQLELWEIYGDVALDPHFDEVQWHDWDLEDDDVYLNAIDEIEKVLQDYIWGIKLRNTNVLRG